MKKLAILFTAVAVLSICASGPAAPEGGPGFGYKTGYSSMMKLGKDMYSFLKPGAKEMISSQPISFQTETVPYVRLLYYEDEPTPVRGVWVSAGFIDLVNNIAHAKAIDRLQRGYFAKYIETLAQETGERALPPLPNDSNPAYWTEDMLNEQLSNFNSIVGIVVGVKLAHHYLAHYDKYKSRIEENTAAVPRINNMITEKEWDEAFTRGVRNALDAGCMIEGVIPFYEAFDKMKVRPKWASFFLPDFAKVSKMKKQMEKIQKDFFANKG